jgi:hypothetical protein
MQLPQLFFAACCVALGTVPAAGFRLVQRALEESRDGYGSLLADAAPVSSRPVAGLDALGSAARFAPLALAAVLGVMFLAAWALAHLGQAKRRADLPWLCGYAREAECNRYVAHNLYGEIKRYFGWLGGAPHPSRPPAHKEP